MSRDIRSFFKVQSSSSKPSEPDSKSKQRSGPVNKKKRAVIESDSDEEVFVTKKQTRISSAQVDTKKPKVEQKSVNAADIFGSDTVKRTTRKSSSSVPELHNDPDFDKVLQDLDESEWKDAGMEIQEPTTSKNSPKKAPAAPVKSPGETETASSRSRKEKLSPGKNWPVATPSGSGSPRCKSFRDESENKSLEVSKESRSNDNERRDPVSSSKKIKIEKDNCKITASEVSKKSRSNDNNDRRDPVSSFKKIKVEKDDCKVTASEVSKKSWRNDNDEREEPESPFQQIKVEKNSNLGTAESKYFTSGRLLSEGKIDKKSAKTHEVEVKIDKPPHASVESKPKLEPLPLSFMWVDKYKPTSLKNIIGQQGDSSNVKKLLRWLSNWHSNHGPGVNKKLVRPSPWAKGDDGAFFKAALLSGPPGVGKTTTAHLVCKELNMDVVEFNASDTRSQKLMSKEVSELLSSKSLVPFFQSGGESKTSSKHVLVMDEVDGMAGNEDRGGVGELINLIKNSKCPVICMCNDRNHPKIRSLAGYCFDLRFHKPRVEQIRGAMMSVCFKEKVQISPQALDEVIAGTNCDIRQVLNNLSMWSATEKKLNPDQVKSDAHAAKKNIKLGPWDAIRKIFTADDHKTMSIMDKSDLFFHDYNLMPLFVQENYLISSPHAVKKKTDLLHHVAQAACSLSYGDLIEKTIRSSNSWSLLPVQSIFSSVVPGEWMEGHLAGQIQFPSWLGKNSRGTKINRLLQDLQTHMRLSISGGKQALNLNYLEPVLNLITQPLISDGVQGVSRTLQAMQDYCITRDDLESLIELCRWPGKADPMAAVDSKVKAALTRTYNKAGGLMTPYALDAPVKKKKATAIHEEGYGEEDEVLSEEDSDEDDVADGMIKTKKPEPRGAALTSGQSSSGRGSRGGSRGNSNSHLRGRGRGRGKK